MQLLFLDHLACVAETSTIPRAWFIQETNFRQSLLALNWSSFKFFVVETHPFPLREYLPPNSSPYILLRTNKIVNHWDKWLHIHNKCIQKPLCTPKLGCYANIGANNLTCAQRKLLQVILWTYTCMHMHTDFYIFLTNCLMFWCPFIPAVGCTYQSILNSDGFIWTPYLILPINKHTIILLKTKLLHLGA